MPPARRRLTRTLGSLQLVGYANNPAKVVTELAFITDEQANVVVAGGGKRETDAPLEVRFNDFVDGVNSRGKGTNTRQRKVTDEQAAAVLLVMVQKGHVELIATEDDPQTIDVIKILPESKRILATFLPKLRGYGDIPYDQQYRGAIALAKRHFFPKGKTPTKKELMALLLQSYQERRRLSLRRQTLPPPRPTLGVQTSLVSVDGSPVIGTASGKRATFVESVASPSPVRASDRSNSQSREEHSNGDVAVEVKSASVTSEVGPDLGDNNDNHDVELERGTEQARLVACTPVASRSFNPYMTPVSNPRYGDHIGAAPLLDTSPTPATEDDIGRASDKDDATDEGIGELLQATATSRGRLNYFYHKFKAACEKITFLEGQKEEIQRKFDLTKRKLDETERYLQEANIDRWKLNAWVDTLLRRIDSIYGQLGLLRRMADPEVIGNGDWSVYDPGLQGAYDPCSM